MCKEVNNIKILLLLANIFELNQIKGLTEQNEKVEKEMKVRDEELFKLKGK